MTNGMILDIDCTHFLVTRTADELNPDGLHAFIDQYADTQVSHLFLNPSGAFAAYDSKVLPSFWQADPARLANASETELKCINHARIVHERGLDLYATWIHRCRTRGISPWLSMRMNDSHYSDNPEHWMLGDFWRNHPEYRRVPGSTRGYADQQLDFAHQEVRQRAMAVVDEYLERYDADGISLDWMRMPQHFAPGREQAGAALLTEFMAVVREKTRQWAGRRGHAIKLAARVPAHPQSARGLGLDGIEWVRRGLVDILVPTPYWGTADFDLPMELWRELLGKSADNVKLAGGAEVLLGAWEFPAARRSNCDIEALRGLTSGILHRGADLVYLFNYFDRSPHFYDGQEYACMIRQVATLQTVLDKPRRYVVTYADTQPPGVAHAYLLPHRLTAPDPAQFRIYTGPKPARGRITLRAGLAAQDGPPPRIEARCNNNRCGQGVAADSTMNLPHVDRLLEYDVPINTLNEGYNLVELFQIDGASPQIVWVELRIDPTAAAK